jgi:hypothetical protein
MNKHVLILITVILASCSGIQNKLTPTSTQEKIIPTRIADSPSTIPESSTNTAAPTTIPTAIPTEIPTTTTSKFPLWMANPGTDVLAALIRDDIKKIREIQFFNAATKEKFNLNPPMDFGGFFWYDNMNFGLLSKDMETAYRFNLETGQMITSSVSSQSTRFLYKDWANGLVTFTDPSSNEMIFDTLWETNKSLNKKYTAEWVDRHVIRVTETATDQFVWESSESKYRYGAEYVWSPVDESQFAFVQGSPEPLNEFITDKLILTVVDVSKGKILSTYSGNFGPLEWSPDGKKILYLDPYFRYRNYGYGFTEAPCFLVLGTGEKRCLRSIPRLIPTGHILLTTGVYHWTKDSNSIFYTYVYSLPSEWAISGNLCNYNLIDGQINCPTEGLAELKDRSVIYYDLPPDEQYIHLCYSKATILNDYADTSNDGVIKTDGTGFFSWVGTIQDGGPQTCSQDTLWRPLP